MTFSGVYVPLITQFDGDGTVALAALRALADDVLAAGAAGLVALGTTGEPASLSAAEQHAVVEVAAGACRRNDAELVVGAHTVEAVRALHDRSGVSAALSLVPPFLRPGQDGVVAFFAAVAAASPVPVLVYHVPYRSGQQLSAATLRRLAAIPGIAGVKLATGGIDAETVELMADPPAGFAVLGGDDALVAPLLALGAHGGVLASAHLATDRFVELVRAWHAGDVVLARALGDALARLALALFAEPNPTVVKAVLHAQGRIPTAAVRLPLLPAGAGSVRAARQLSESEPVPAPDSAQGGAMWTLA